MAAVKEELILEREDAASQVADIDSEYAGQRFPDDVRERWNDLNAKVDDLDETIKELERREARVAENAGKGNTERAVDEPKTINVRKAGGDIFDLGSVRRSYDDPTVEGRDLHERAERMLETIRPQIPSVSREDAQTGAAGLLARHDTPDGKLARYYLATGSPTYNRAFGKLLAKSFGGAATLTGAEQSAVFAVQEAERALSLTGASGGFAVPFELDTTILLTNAGVVNPIRRIARVETGTGDEWRGITSAGVTASYAAEATETTDNAPTLVQPTVSTEKAQAWIPFSIEVDMDWGGMRQQMGVLLEDAKDTLEAQKFATGTGTNEPFGVVTGTTNTVNATTGQTFTLANLYSLIGALPSRYQPRAAFVGDLQILNRMRQFDTVGSSAAIWVDSLQDGVPARLLGKPVYEASEMADTPATGSKFLIYGDFSRYLIYDRIGLQVEVVPHVFGANRRPTGERGLYAYWRNGAKVIDANAFRALIGIV